MQVETAFNYRRVNDSLVTSGLLNEQQLAALGEQGFSCVINLLPDDSEYAIATEAQLIGEQYITYHYIPVDFSAPAESDFIAFADAMEQCVGCKTLVHCAANYRVSAFYSLYAMDKGIWSQQQADEWVDAIWKPADFPAWQGLINKLRSKMGTPG